MKLQQLRFLREVRQKGLNISAAAKSLHTSQPGISTQIRLLEEELGIRLFERHGKLITGLTPAGKKIIDLSDDILKMVTKIKKIAADTNAPDQGVLSIATTHAQACYVLPSVFTEFSRYFPNIKLNLQQGTPKQISEMASRGQVDFAIASEAINLFDDLTLLPCYRWNKSIIAPIDHPITKIQPLTLEVIAEFPIITYVFGFTGRSKLDRAFNQKQLTPNVVITAADTDVIKTYVREKHGIGIIATMGFKEDDRKDLCCIDASHLFESNITWLGLKQGFFLREFQYKFIQTFAPHLSQKKIERALSLKSKSQISQLFKDIELPNR